MKPLKYLIIAAMGLSTLAPVSASAYTVVLQNATVSGIHSHSLDRASKTVATPRLIVVPRVEPPKLIPIPVPFPGPVCLSCPPFDLNERLVQPSILK